MPSDSSQSTESGFGAALKAKWGPLPVWAWLGLVTVAILGYALFTGRKAATQNTTPTPSDAGQPGVVVINQGSPPGAPPPPPGTQPPPEPGGGGGSVRSITVDKDETLAEFARSRHWTAETLHDVEQMNVTQGGGHWTPSTKLTKGETVLRPIGGN